MADPSQYYGGADTGEDTFGGYREDGTPNYSTRHYRRMEGERQAQREGAGAPLAGWLTGADSRYAAAQNQRLADERLDWWRDINVPTADQLAQHYDYDSRGGAEGLSAQESALGQLGQWARGGLTDTDRRMLETTRLRDAQAARAQSGALQQQYTARGMGGSGSEFASRMMAEQQGQQQASDAESQMMQGAQQRALAAVQAQAQLGSDMRQRSEHETEHQQDAYTNAIQTEFQDRAQRAAGANNAQTGQQQGSQFSQQMQQQNNRDLLNTVGSAVTALFA